MAKMGDVMINFIQFNKLGIEEVNRYRSVVKFPIEDKSANCYHFRRDFGYKVKSIDFNRAIIFFEETQINSIGKSKRKYMKEISEKEVFLFVLNVQKDNSNRIHEILEENRYHYSFEETVHKKFCKVKIECTVFSAQLVKQLLKGLYGK